MPIASEQVVAGRRPGASRQWAVWLVAIILVLIAGGLASYIYNTTRLDNEQREAGIAATGGDPDAARAILTNYGCGGCHTIPGIPKADGQVGPELTNIARRVYVGGVIPNTPDNLVNFIVNPRSIDPQSAMPVTGITPAQARDVAAYLYGLRG